MRVGVYVNGFNLYYGARGLCGRGTSGWRWLDLRALATDLVSRRTSWPGAQVDRVVYCTARIDGASNPSGQADQDVYLKALLTAGSVDHIEYGTYVARVKTAPLAVKDPQGRPRLVGPQWPVMIQDGRGGQVGGAVFMVSYANREEKGSDVNVAAHLLLDVLSGADRRCACHLERQRSPVSGRAGPPARAGGRRQPVPELPGGRPSWPGECWRRAALVGQAHVGRLDGPPTAQPGRLVSSSCRLVRSHRGKPQVNWRVIVDAYTTRLLVGRVFSFLPAHDRGSYSVALIFLGDTAVLAVILSRSMRWDGEGVSTRTARKYRNRGGSRRTRADAAGRWAAGMDAGGRDACCLQAGGQGFESP